MTAVSDKLGSRWLLAWQLLTVVAFLPCVALPAALPGLSAMRLGPHHEPFSLANLSGLIEVASYYFAIALVNGVLVARAMRAHWVVATLVGLAAACALGVTSGTLLYEMADSGGPLWIAAAWIGLVAMLILNLGAPCWTRSGVPTHTAAFGSTTRESACSRALRARGHPS